MLWQHMAYEDGGIEVLEQAARDGRIKLKQMAAWDKIDQGIRTGDQEKIWAGNRDMLHFEQQVIAQPMYDRNPEMWDILSRNGYEYGDWPIIGPFVEFPSVVDNGITFHDYIKNGNVGNFNDRWDWMENSILPEWKELEANRDAVLEEYNNRHILGDPLQ